MAIYKQTLNKVRAVDDKRCYNICNMIKDVKVFEEFEREEIKKEKPGYFKSLRIFEALWNEGVSLGVLPLKDPLEDIETDIRIARILNSQNV